MTIMKCGCAANGYALRDGLKVSCCVIHNETLVNEHQPDLSERRAKCDTCGKVTDSSTGLAFFRLTSGPTDSFYCGCMGWD